LEQDRTEQSTGMNVSQLSHKQGQSPTADFNCLSLWA